MIKRNRLKAIVLYFVLAVTVVVMLIPFVWVLGGSFKTQNEFIADPGAWFPKSFANFNNYIVLFTEKGFATYLRNSAIVSVVTVVANLVFGSMAGYALAKFEFRGRQIVFVMVIAALTIPYVALFVPQFLIIVQMHLVDTLVAIIIPMLVLPLSVFIMRQFAYSIPNELLEAARIDGAGEFRVFFRIFMPLVRPALATTAILTFLFSWNVFLWPLIVAQSQSTFTLPVGLAIASQASNTTAYGILLAGAVVVMLPVVILFLFLQRYFIQGMATVGMK